MSDKPVISLPVLPLRDIVVFPHMIVPLFVGRDKSIKELEAESVAMLVCNSYDIDTCKCSFDYIIGHNTRNKDVQESMLNAGDRIYKAHKEITTIVDKHLKEVTDAN